MNCKSKRDLCKLKCLGKPTFTFTINNRGRHPYVHKNRQAEGKTQLVGIFVQAFCYNGIRKNMQRSVSYDP